MRVADTQNLIKAYEVEQLITILEKLKNIQENCYSSIKAIENIINLKHYDFKESVIVCRRKDE